MNHMELKHLSASTIDAFLICPRRQYLSALHKDEARVPSSFLIAGTAAHEALRRYHTDKEDSRPLIELFKDEVKKEGLIPFETFKSACEYLSEYEFNNPRDANIVFVEKEFIINIGGYPVKGFIDRVDYLGDGHYEIIDYKTGWVAKSQAELDDDIQLMTYDIALRTMAESGEVLLPAPIEEVTVSLYYLKHDKMSTSFTDEQRATYTEFVTLVGDALKEVNDEPTPRLNNFCRYCEFAGDCVLYNSDFATAFKLSIDVPLDELAAQMDALKKMQKVIYQRMDKVEDLLKGYMEPEGVDSLDTENYHITVNTKMYKRYDMDKLRELLPDKFYKYVSVKASSLDKADEGDKAIINAISTTYRSKPYVQVARNAKGKKKDVNG
jgi:CRISPR/Cas system-associated exonuclease Cas4 (RecB family)